MVFVAGVASCGRRLLRVLGLSGGSECLIFRAGLEVGRKKRGSIRYPVGPLILSTGRTIAIELFSGRLNSVPRSGSNDDCSLLATT